MDQRCTARRHDRASRRGHRTQSHRRRSRTARPSPRKHAETGGSWVPYSMSRRIDHGQALRSIFGRSRVTHFIQSPVLPGTFAASRRSWRSWQAQSRVERTNVEAAERFPPQSGCKVPLWNLLRICSLCYPDHNRDGGFNGDQQATGVRFGSVEPGKPYVLILSGRHVHPCRHADQDTIK